MVPFFIPCNTLSFIVSYVNVLILLSSVAVTFTVLLVTQLLFVLILSKFNIGPSASTTFIILFIVVVFSAVSLAVYVISYSPTLALKLTDTVRLTS